MSVLACSVLNCDNIMCNRLSDEYGYICDNCFDRLLIDRPTTDEEMRRFLSTSMLVLAGTYNYDYYNDIFSKHG